MRACASDFCAPNIPGPLTAWPWVSGAGWLRLEVSRVELVDAADRSRWTVPLLSSIEPDLIAEGDFTGDGVPDFIVEEVRPTAQTCGTHVMDETQLVFIDGAAGRAWRPVAPMLDVCWPSYGYATHQWVVGSAYIGPFGADVHMNDVILFPYYAQYGTVLQFNPRLGWRTVRGVDDRIPYPSTDAFDSTYDASNAQSCSMVAGSDHCWVKYSHVANAIFVDPSSPALLLLTSHRAVIYSSDFTPTSDVAWSYEEGGGRDYGLVDSVQTQDGQMVTLVGGCSVAKSRDDMRTGTLSTDQCGLFHHYEYFFVHRHSIVQHDGAPYGWFGTVGLWQDRLEFPFPSLVPLTGGAPWSVFNLYRDGEWRAQLMPNPADPGAVIEAPGWFVWGSVSDRNGGTLLVATRTAATGVTSTASYIPPWDFDLLAWRDGGLVSVAHHQGVIPSLALYPPGPGYHVSDGDTFGMVEDKSNRGALNSLLVEASDGIQSWVGVPNLAAV